jgi:uncharacterized MAPEG superfamily protein
MDALTTNPAFQTYAACVAILALKMLASAIYTGVQRQRSHAYTNDEDARVFGQGGPSATAQDSPAVAHALRIQRNDGESIPIFFALGLVYVLSGASASGAAIYCWTYTVARIGHTIAYVGHLQPWRGIFFVVGLLTQIGMAVQLMF